MAIVDKIKNRLSRSGKSGNEDEQSCIPPLKHVDLPRIKPSHYPALANQGWTTVTFSGAQDPLNRCLARLFEASKTFFALPREEKAQFLTRDGSEDGWNRIDGEKEFITLRTIDHTPVQLKRAATEAWRETSNYMNEVLGLLATTLALPPEALTQYSLPCAELNANKTATMLRLFRYEGHEAKVVAEPHADLGLLSFVIGDTPGLEVWNRYTQDFWPIEKTYNRPAGSLLAGRQLERLSNVRYQAGGHLVRSYGVSQTASRQTEAPVASVEGPYRYSIVFVLRAHSPVPIDTDTLTTPITGPFTDPLRNTTAGELFRNIKGQYFNVNTNMDDREQQKKEIAARKQAALKDQTPLSSGLR